MISTEFIDLLSEAWLEGNGEMVDELLDEVPDAELGPVMEVCFICQGMKMAGANEDWMNRVLDQAINVRYTGKQVMENDGRKH